MTHVNNVNPAVNQPVKFSKGKKIGTALGTTAGIGGAVGIVVTQKDSLVKTYNQLLKSMPKDTVSLTTKSGKEIIKNIPKKTAALGSVAAPVAGIALAVTAAGALVGGVAGAIADKAAAKKAQ